MTETSRPPLACIILAAGRGTRMKSALPKVMHPLAGRPLITWLAQAAAPLKPAKMIVVTAPGMEDVAAALPGALIAIQDPPRGTGDAVRAALPLLKDFTGDVLVLLGDMPLLSTATLAALVDARHRDAQTGLSVLGAHFDHPPAYGRLALGATGAVRRIIEDRDCTPDERNLKLCSLGAYCLDGARLADWAGQIDNKNAQQEYYFTDIVEIAAAAGAATHVHVTRDVTEAAGVNSRADLALLEQAVQTGLRRRAMDDGATLVDPATTYLSWDTALGRDVIVEPHVWFGPGVTVADNVHIKAFSHIEGAMIAAGAVVGPFARLRPGAVIGADARIGNFVEIKNARLGEGAKANHLAYIGDAEVGARSNIGCGVITANYDGVNKHKTVIGNDVMVGSNATLIAPVEIGAGAYIAAGSTITDNVPADALAIARDRQSVRENWAGKKRKKPA